MTKTYDKTISNNIRAVRKAKGIKQSELAQAAGTQQSRIAEYETERIDIRNMTLETAFKIAQALDSSLDEVFTKTNENIELEYKFGIFKACCELRNPESAWDFVEADESIDKPLEVFKTQEEAIKRLHEKYENSIYKNKSNGGFYFYQGEVYFVGTLMINDSDEEESIDNYLYENGVDIIELDI